MILKVSFIQNNYISPQVITHTHEAAQVRGGLLSSVSNPHHVLAANIPVVIAWFEEMQAIVTVWAGVLSEKPAPKAA